MPVRIGFAGVGAMGQCAHLRNYVLVDDAAVVAIAEPHPSKREQVATRYNVPTTYASLEEMLAGEELDLIVASQPFTRHGQLVPAVLDRGIPVFTEKPLAATVAVGRQLVGQADERGVPYFVGYHKRSDPATVLARQTIQSWHNRNDIGRMTYVRILMPAGDWIAGGFDDLIRGQQDDLPCGDLATDPDDEEMSEEERVAYRSFVNYYIHQVNLLRHLLGEDYQVTHVDAAGMLFVAESCSGITGVIEMSPYKTTVDWQEQALVCFEHGWIRLDLPAPLASNRPGRVTVFEDVEGSAPETRTPQLPWTHAMRQQAEYVVRAVQGARTPLCEAREALGDLQIAREVIHMMYS